MKQMQSSDFKKVLAQGAFYPETRFASPERATRQEFQASLDDLTSEPLLHALLETLGARLLVLNRHRQILLASRDLLKDFELCDVDPLAGFRPGEALDCVHAWETPGGCGTAEACSTCGAVLAIVRCQQSGRAVEQECLMRVRKGEAEEAREFRVKASPLKLRSEDFVLISLTDISAEKRREALEKVFFHDILNTISGLHGWSRVLQRNHPGAPDSPAERIRFLAERLNREIQDHRALIMAERGMLETVTGPVRPNAVLEMIEAIFAGHEESREKKLELILADSDEQIITDDSLVIRVLTNMVKNALEATPAGGTVRVWTRSNDVSYQFLVGNAGTIPRHIALQIFRRSFSTKGEKGSGIGTFSMKLFGERYLGGKVTFTSSEAEGTVFSLSLPKTPPGAAGQPEK